jgi:hypothetical protein
VKQYFRSQYWKGQRLLLLVFLLLHVIVSCIYISWQNLTFDEKDYYGYSVKWLHGDVDRNNKIYDSKTPVVAIATVPRIIKQVIIPGYKAKDAGIADIRKGRYMMVLFTLITAIYLFMWSRKLFGEKAWILPVLFFLFDPLVLGFSMIVTSDMASGMCLLACSFHLWQLYLQKNIKQLIYFSIWLSLGLVCKASLLFFIPYMLIVFFILIITGKQRFHLKKLIGYAAVAGAIVIAAINLAYFGKGSFRSLKQAEFQSTSFRSLATTNFVKEIPVPLPYSYIQGLDMLQYHGEIGAGHPESTHHGTFLGNRSKDKGGFWYYYLYVGFYKIPIATLLLLIGGLFIVIFGFRNEFFKKHIWYLLPFIFFLAILSCFNPFQTGFRHILLIYPFCFLFIAAAITFFERRFRPAKPVASAMFVYMIVTAIVYFPWLIPYTNEFMGNKKLVYRKIRDSSIDYGHNISQLEKFRKANPAYEAAYPVPKVGKYIVGAYELNTYKGRENASWLRNFQPVSHYQYSMFLFHISENDLIALKQKGRQ